MKVLIVNTSERTGGAAVAANRLKEALNNNGAKAKMLVMDKQTDDITVIDLNGGWRSRWAFLWERLCIFFRLHFSREHLFDVDIANIGHDITCLPEFKEADVIHLHWINQGMLSVNNIRKILKSGKLVVWTMHDMWPATGICHVTLNCEQFKSGCRCCPLLPGGGGEHDLSNIVWQRKRKLLDNSNIEFVAVSSWLAANAKASALLKGQHVSIIPNSISTTKFRLKDRMESCDSLNIQGDRHIVVFGAARIDTPEKGLDYLKKALAWLVEEHRFERDKLLLLLFGGYRSDSVFEDIPVPYRYLGYVSDESSLSTVYSAADVVVSSSMSETFGQTLIEAQACGCVPVSFNNSGQTDIIRHKETGYLAEYLSVEDLGRGIEWALNAGLQRREQRQYVTRHFSDSSVALRYVNLYNELLDKNNG